MPYRFAVRHAVGHAVEEEAQLLVVVFEGEITPEEEREALMAVAEVPGLSKQANILVDRRLGPLAVGPEDVPPQIDLAAAAFGNSDKPKMAVVVSSNYDFGMFRMLELRGHDQLPHDLKVFRDLEPACEWIGVDPLEIDWP